MSNAEIVAEQLRQFSATQEQQRSQRREEMLALGARVSQLTAVRPDHADHIFQAIIDAGMDPTTFNDVVEDDPQYSYPMRTWIHKQRHVFFQVRYDSNFWHVTASPSPSRPDHHQPEEKSHISQWHTVRQMAAIWATAASPIVNSPDLWAQVRNREQVVRMLDSADNSPFTKPEQERIAQGLAQLRKDLDEAAQRAGLQAERVEALHKKLDHLAESSERSGRRDWFFGMVGVVALVQAEIGGFAPAIAKFWEWISGEAGRLLGG